MNVDLGNWALKNRPLVMLFVAVFLAGGLYAYFSMPKLEDPEIIVRQALVVGIYPGANAWQVELEMADPLEKSIRQADGVDFLDTRCYRDMCIIKVSLLTTVRQEDIRQIWDVVRHKVDATKLPEGATTLVEDDFGDVFGMFYAVSGKGFSDGELSAYSEMLQRELQVVEGVSRISLYGMPRECIRVEMNPERLANLGVHPLEVIQTLRGQNAVVYSGYCQAGGNRMRVSVDDRYRNVDDMAGLLINGHDGGQIRLGDIATIVREEEKPVREYMERDGCRAVGLSISAESGTDIIKVGRAVEKKIEELRRSKLPVGLEMDKVFYQPDKVSDAMGSFMRNLLVSVLLVILVLVFTMGIKSGLIIGWTLVITIAGSVMILYYMGGTLQRVSLCSFIFAMGMLVDNSIVVVDEILVARAGGRPLEESLESIGRRIAIPLLGATFIAILSFFPIFLSKDVTGLYVHDMFIVLAVSLLLSWLLALTYVPVLAKRRIYPYPVSATEGADRGALPYLILEGLLSVLLKHRWTAVFVMAGLLVLTGIGFLFIPQSLFPDIEYDQLYMEYKLPENRNFTQVNNDLDSISRYLSKKPYITHIVKSTGGTPSRYNLVRSVHLPSLSYGELIIDFKSSRKLEKEIYGLQKEVEEMFPDAYIRFKRYNLMFLNYPVQLDITGPDPEVLGRIKEECTAIFKEAGTFELITDEWEPDVPAFVVGYDQARARYAGLSRQEVGTSLLASTEGLPVGCFYDGMHPLNVYVCVGDGEKGAASDINESTVFGLEPDLSALMGAGDSRRSAVRSEPLRQITDGASVVWETPVVCRYNGKRTMMVCGVPAQGVLNEEARLSVVEALREVELPDGYSMRWNGEKLARDMSINNLFHYYPLALLLILTILLLLFRKVKTVALLFLSIPVVLVGMVAGLLASGSTLNFVSIVGSLGLVGMIVKNGIILVDEINDRVRTEPDMDIALTEASLSRLRPVTMAAFTTILGMIPLLFDTMFKSMAAAIIGGLFIGTLIVLILIPVLYSLLFKGDSQIWQQE